MKFILILSFLFIFVSCRKDKADYNPTPYQLEIPSHFPDMIIPSDNPMTKEGVELGRYLFYEKQLSGDNSMNCATCHMPEHAFSDPNKYSVGIEVVENLPPDDCTSVVVILNIKV